MGVHSSVAVYVAEILSSTPKCQNFTPYLPNRALTMARYWMRGVKEEGRSYTARSTMNSLLLLPDELLQLIALQAVKEGQRLSL